MCYTHTIYHTLCGCYSKPQFFGEPCIRAQKGAGLSYGCWDKIDMGVDSEDSMCPRCRSPGSRSRSFDSGYESSGSTLVDSRRTSDASSASASSAQTLVEVRSESNAGTPTSASLTVPADAAMKRVGSARSFGSISSTISSTTAAGYAHSLLAGLPKDIPRVKRNASGVAISWRSMVQTEKPKEPAPGLNMHWRAYNNGAYEGMR